MIKQFFIAILFATILAACDTCMVNKPEEEAPVETTVTDTSGNSSSAVQVTEVAPDTLGVE